MRNVDFKLILRLLWIFGFVAFLVVVARLLNPEGIQDEPSIDLWNMKVGDLFLTILGTALLFGIIILLYKMQYKIGDWWNKRKQKANF